MADLPKYDGYCSVHGPIVAMPDGRCPECDYDDRKIRMIISETRAMLRSVLNEAADRFNERPVFVAVPMRRAIWRSLRSWFRRTGKGVLRDE